jgi:uncharacterized protein YndB with AHSA1/START domain
VPEILHRISIDASPERGHELVSTKSGLEQWWSGHPVEGDETIGGRLSFSFGGPDPAAVMQIVEDRPEQTIWRCVDGPADWLDTEIEFEFRPNSDGGTTLLFTHANWNDANEFMANCSSEWASYLIGIKKGLEGGAFTPYPVGQVSRWR